MSFQGLNKSTGGILRITLMAGLILFVIACILFTSFLIYERINIKQKDSSFNGILREYDISARGFNGTEKEYEKLNSELNKLEKRAIGVESWLSILKRRRNLARFFPPSTHDYRSSINRAITAYPSSQPLAAVYAAAIVKDTALNRETEEELRNLLLLIDSPSFNTLRLGLHVLLGDFRSPERALALPEEIFSDGTEDITVDLIITKAVRADYRGASSEIQSVLNSPFPPSGNLIRLAAEYYYDFGDLGRSAELFSRLDDENAMVRQADALYLAGFPGAARSIWFILSPSLNENSIYNLAVSSADREESLFWLEQIVNSDSASDKVSRQFALIRYSRLLPYEKAINTLENAGNLTPADFPFIDLEICKRRQHQGEELGRQMAETWLLLDRHPESEELYQWAAWFTFFQHFYDETDILLKRIYQFHKFAGWVEIYKALLYIEKRDLYTAENILMEISTEEEDLQTSAWPVYANLGRIIEADLSHTRALEQYGFAAEKAQNPKSAAKIQIRMAKCYSALGRIIETRRALQNALELDPENLTARLELDRLGF